MSKYKIVFIDIDGTLFNTKFKTSNLTKEVIGKLTQKGILVVLTSGRNAYQVREISKEANASQYIIASNGAEVFDYQNNLDIYRTQMDHQVLKEIYDFCQSHDLKIYFNAGYKRFMNQPDITPYPENVLIKDYKEIENEIISQIVIQSTNFNRMLVLKDFLLSKYEGLKNINSSSSLNNIKPVPNEFMFRDFIPEHISKSSGIIRLLEYLKIEPEEAVSLGDGLNDLSMLELTGFSVAMGNAVDELKENADLITSSNDEDGVAYALKEIFEID